MSDFPTLSVTPSVGPWKQTKVADPTIRSSFEGGYVQTRPRFTRIPKSWDVAYQGGNSLPLADKALLEAHEDNVHCGGAIFSWLCPVDSVTYQVRYKAPIIFTMLHNKLYWTASFTLEQA
jgi:hypothetical protein